MEELKNTEEENTTYSSNSINGEYNFIQSAQVKKEPEFNSIELMPQAIVRETRLESYDAQDWRKIFAKMLKGKGLEIGPLHRPLEKHWMMRMTYVDRYPIDRLKKEYPEIAEQIHIDPHILDDGGVLSTVEDKSFSFVVAAHVIEHMSNPLLSLENWRRVVRGGGYIYLIVPDKRVIFDSKRVRTTLEHIISDYYSPSKERDFEHFLDFAHFVNGKTGLEAYKQAKQIQETDYSIHYHTFIPSDVINLVNWFNDNIAGLEIVSGPSMAPGSDEFHLMLKRVDSNE